MSDYDQRPQEDTLVDRGVDDALDEGYSPPERLPSTHTFGTTAAEQREGENLDQRVLQEEPDVMDEPLEPREDEREVPITAETRSGRLVAPDEGAHPDEEKDVVARDVGIDGGAASAEEAAVHVEEREP